MKVDNAPNCSVNNSVTVNINIKGFSTSRFLVWSINEKALVGV
jgi:hypothetical protein